MEMNSHLINFFYSPTLLQIPNKWKKPNHREMLRHWCCLIREKISRWTLALGCGTNIAAILAPVKCIRVGFKHFEVNIPILLTLASECCQTKGQLGCAWCIFSGCACHGRLAASHSLLRDWEAFVGVWWGGSYFFSRCDPGCWGKRGSVAVSRISFSPFFISLGAWDFLPRHSCNSWFPCIFQARVGKSPVWPPSLFLGKICVGV